MLEVCAPEMGQKQSLQCEKSAGLTELELGEPAPPARVLVGWRGYRLEGQLRDDGGAEASPHACVKARPRPSG